MSDKKKYVVPDYMVEYVWGNCYVVESYTGPSRAEVKAILELGAQWLTENPIVPNPEQYMDLRDEQGNDFDMLLEWQRRMFLAPELPAELEALLLDNFTVEFTGSRKRYNQDIIAAYELGKKAGNQ